MVKTQAVRLTLPRESERSFQIRVKEYAELRGWRVQWWHDSRHSPRGWPDLTMLRRGKLAFMELKVREALGLREYVHRLEQQACLDELGLVPGVIFAEIVMPKDWPRILEVLT